MLVTELSHESGNFLAERLDALEYRATKRKKLPQVLCTATIADALHRICDCRIQCSQRFSTRSIKKERLDLHIRKEHEKYANPHAHLVLPDPSPLARKYAIITYDDQLFRDIYLDSHG